MAERKHWLALGTAVSVILASHGPAALGGETASRQDWCYVAPGSPYVWAGDDLPVEYAVHLGPGVLTGVAAGTDSAHQIWEDAVSYHSWGMVRVEDLTTDLPPYQNYVNQVAWRTDWPADQPETRVGYTEITWVGSSGFMEIDTILNAEYWSWAYRSYDCWPCPEGEPMDVTSMALHEFGHWLYLDHPPWVSCWPCVMYFPWADRIRRELCDGDAAGLADLYGETPVAGLKSFEALPGNGYIYIRWEFWDADSYHCVLYSLADDGQAYMPVDEQAAYDYSFYFSDDSVANDVSYHYILEVNGEYAGPWGPYTPSGSSALAEIAGLGCLEGVDGCRVAWQTSAEVSSLDGFEVRRAPTWDWPAGTEWSGAKRVEGPYQVLNAELIEALGAPGVYEYVDESALYGQRYTYVIQAKSGSDDERHGPCFNPCWKPEASQCSAEFLGGQPECPLICPAGDAPGGPVVEVTIRDSCGFGIPGYPPSIYLHAAVSDTGTFAFCCDDEQPTVLSATTMRPTDWTDGQGVAAYNLDWGGGCDGAVRLHMTVEGEAIPDTLSMRVRSPDINGDCQVGQDDFALLSSYYTTTAWQADLDCSGTVGLADFGLLAAHYGHSCVSSRTLPIPGELVAQLGQPREGRTQQVEPSLEANKPNPFSPMTEIAYSIPGSRCQVKVAVYALSGRLVRILAEGEVSAGRRVVTWDGTDDQGRAVASGVYLYRIEAPGLLDQRKMVLLR